MDYLAVSNNSCTFAPEASRAVPERVTRQPSFNLYTKYALQFADMQISELVTVFNHQVGNTGWTGMRAYHDQALINEFQRRGIDVSTVYDDHSISFAKPVKYDLDNNKLIIIG